MSAKLISVFNNKGGVGKTTLTFHLAHALAELGKKVLLMDLDPQCNLTIYSMGMEAIHSMWEREDPFIDDFENTRKNLSPKEFAEINGESRTVHYLLMPAQEGTGELDTLPPPVRLGPTLDLLPGRLTLHLYEDKLASRWSDIYRGDVLAIRTATQIRRIAEAYAKQSRYDIIIVDTSPSLGSLNKAIISNVDGFVIPCLPDLFSLYGIRNIGNALVEWERQFRIIQNLLSDEKRRAFPSDFVRFLGFTIYNARRYAGVNDWDLAKAHYNYAKSIPDTIRRYLPQTVRSTLPAQALSEPIGGTSVMHTHNTLPAMAQKYKLPIWRLPSCTSLEAEDRPTIMGNRSNYEATRENYLLFAKDVLGRMTAGGINV